MDLVKARNAFKNYLKDYDVQDGGIALKIRHTYEVISKSEYIARLLGLDEEDIDLAKLIALLHDIGRFEQIKEFKDFDDTKLEHAQFGVKVLFEDGLIREFIEDDKYDEIIYKAIYNHNKINLENGLTDTELLHSKIIRDADKLDNFRVKEKDDIKDIFPGFYDEDNLYYEVISQKVFEDFMNHKLITNSDRRSYLDCWVGVLAFIFDLNFPVSLQYVKDNNYIDKLIDRLQYRNPETREKIEQIRRCAKDFIEKSIKKG